MSWRDVSYEVSVRVNWRVEARVARGFTGQRVNAREAGAARGDDAPIFERRVGARAAEFGANFLMVGLVFVRGIQWYAWI